MAPVRESIMWRWDGQRLRFLVCLPELRTYYAHGGWKPLGTFIDDGEIEEVRQSEEFKWTPQIRRRARWRLRKQRRRWEGSGE